MEDPESELILLWRFGLKSRASSVSEKAPAVSVESECGLGFKISSFVLDLEGIWKASVEYAG